MPKDLTTLDTRALNAEVDRLLNAHQRAQDRYIDALNLLEDRIIDGYLAGVRPVDGGADDRRRAYMAALLAGPYGVTRLEGAFKRAQDRTMRRYHALPKTVEHADERFCLSKEEIFFRRACVHLAGLVERAREAEQAEAQAENAA